MSTDEESFMNEEPEEINATKNEKKRHLKSLKPKKNRQT